MSEIKKIDSMELALVSGGETRERVLHTRIRVYCPNCGREMNLSKIRMVRTPLTRERKIRVFHCDGCGKEVTK